MKKKVIRLRGRTKFVHEKMDGRQYEDRGDKFHESNEIEKDDEGEIEEGTKYDSEGEGDDKVEEEGGSEDGEISANLESAGEESEHENDEDNRVDEGKKECLEKAKNGEDSVKNIHPSRDSNGSIEDAIKRLTKKFNDIVRSFNIPQQLLNQAPLLPFPVENVELIYSGKDYEDYHEQADIDRQLNRLFQSGLNQQNVYSSTPTNLTAVGEGGLGRHNNATSQNIIDIDSYQEPAVQETGQLQHEIPDCYNSEENSGGNPNAANREIEVSPSSENASAKLDQFDLNSFANAYIDASTYESYGEISGADGPLEPEILNARIDSFISTLLSTDSTILDTPSTVPSGTITPSQLPQLIHALTPPATPATSSSLRRNTQRYNALQRERFLESELKEDYFNIRRTSKTGRNLFKSSNFSSNDFTSITNSDTSNNEEIKRHHSQGDKPNKIESGDHQNVYSTTPTNLTAVGEGGLGRHKNATSQNIIDIDSYQEPAVQETGQPQHEIPDCYNSEENYGGNPNAACREIEVIPSSENASAKLNQFDLNSIANAYIDASTYESYGEISGADGPLEPEILNARIDSFISTLLSPDSPILDAPSTVPSGTITPSQLPQLIHALTPPATPATSSSLRSKTQRQRTRQGQRFLESQLNADEDIRRTNKPGRNLFKSSNLSRNDSTSSSTSATNSQTPNNEEIIRHNPPVDNSNTFASSDLFESPQTHFQENIQSKIKTSNSNVIQDDGFENIKDNHMSVENDNDGDIQVNNGAPENQAQPMWRSIKKNLPRIDGLMVMGKTWNIVTIYGQINFKDRFLVRKEQASYYKGLPEATTPKHRYEITFAEIDNGSLSVLITSPFDTKNGHMLNFLHMGIQMRDLIKWVIQDTHSKTRNEFDGRGPGDICIYEQDWQQIGDKLSDSLYRLCEGEKSAYPLQCKFYYLFKKFGQDKEFNNQDEENRRLHDFPHLQLIHASRLIVHVALDRELDNSALFFTPKFWKTLGETHPSKNFNVCLIPNTGNYVYTCIPANDRNIVSIQQYTRLFHPVHRNKFNFFNDNVIGKQLMMAFTSKITGQRRDQNKFIHAILAGEVEKLCTGIRRTISEEQTILARSEYVWSVKIKPDSSNHFVEQLDAAVKDSLLFESDFNCCPHNQFKIIGRTELRKYLLGILNPMFDLLIDSTKKLIEFLKVSIQDTYESEHMLQLHDFARITVAEALTRLMLRGKLEHFPQFILDHVYRNLDPKTNALRPWPFRSTIYLESESGERLTHLKKVSEPRIVILSSEDEDMEVDPTNGNERHEPNTANNSYPDINPDTKVIFQTTITVHDLFKDITTLFKGASKHADILPLFGAYQDWKKRLYDITRVRKKFSEQMFQQFVIAVIRGLVRVNKYAEDFELDYHMDKLWDGGKPNTKQKLMINQTLRLFNAVTDISQSTVKELTPVIMFGQLLKVKMSGIKDGGSQLTTALVTDKLIQNSGVPFTLRLPNHKLLRVFLPIMFNLVTDRMVSLYVNAFFALFPRLSTNKMQNIVRQLFVSVLETVALIKQDNRYNLNLHCIFMVVRDIAGKKANAFSSKDFQSLPTELQDLLSKQDNKESKKRIRLSSSLSSIGMFSPSHLNETIPESVQKQTRPLTRNYKKQLQVEELLNIPPSSATDNQPSYVTEHAVCKNKKKNIQGKDNVGTSTITTETHHSQGSSSANNSPSSTSPESPMSCREDEDDEAELSGNGMTEGSSAQMNKRKRILSSSSKSGSLTRADDSRSVSNDRSDFYNMENTPTFNADLVESESCLSDYSLSSNDLSIGEDFVEARQVSDTIHDEVFLEFPYSNRNRTQKRKANTFSTSQSSEDSRSREEEPDCYLTNEDAEANLNDEEFNESQFQRESQSAGTRKKRFQSKQAGSASRIANILSRKQNPEFTKEETIKIFSFLISKNWLRYMLGLLPSRVMVALKIVDRPSSSICSFITRSVKQNSRRIKLKEYLGEDVVKQIDEALESIKPYKKGENRLPSEEIVKLGLDPSQIPP